MPLGNQQVSRKYELERQPEVLKLASRYFAAITEAATSGVCANRHAGSENRDSRRRVLSPPQLSQGTVEQLYLAIRFALAVQSPGRRWKFPFADDILVNFDHSA